MQVPFEIVKTKLGATSVKNNLFGGEILHNPVGPWPEAKSLYVGHSKLTERLLESDGDSLGIPLVIFDVGLGMATNALAAIDTQREMRGLGQRTRPLTIISFENDLSMLSFALENTESLEFLKPYESAVRTLLSHGEYQSDDGSIYWRLRKGDFVQLLHNEKIHCDIIFFDPYSPKTNGPMWDLSIFEKLSHLCNPGATLITYSASTKVRTSLLLAGFFVGQGPGTGLKLETTIASKGPENLSTPLDSRWFARWERSDQGIPDELAQVEKGQIRQNLAQHPQFASCQI